MANFIVIFEDETYAEAGTSDVKDIRSSHETLEEAKAAAETDAKICLDGDHEEYDEDTFPLNWDGHNYVSISYGENRDAELEITIQAV